MLKETDVREGLDSFWSEFEPAVGACEHGNDPSSPIKCREFLD
jgi:hypothetical protein